MCGRRHSGENVYNRGVSDNFHHKALLLAESYGEGMVHISRRNEARHVVNFDPTCSRVDDDDDG